MTITPMSPATSKHPLIQDGYFYTLPSRLLESVVASVGERQLDSEVLQIDRELTSLNGSRSDLIGFCCGIPIQYGFLADPPRLEIAIKRWKKRLVSKSSWSKHRCENIAAQRQLQCYSDWMRQMLRGYCGWLCLNPVFVSEQAAFLERWRVQSVYRGLGTQVPTFTVASSDDGDNVPDEFRRALDSFLLRWQLEGLAGPFLPLPLMPRFPYQVAAVSTKHQQCGAAFYLPRIMPLPPRGMLRELMEGALARSAAPEHLREWISIVQSDNPSKMTITKYGRIFRVQHYWRVLHGHYGQALNRYGPGVQRALAEYLTPRRSQTAISKTYEVPKKDLAILRKLHSNQNWLQNPHL